ncbi:hypothetical protein RJT34_05896 [Clitoria ternatea]|uniref:ZF-HD dimerization-type domain-containing protein n=1 Tax=Clitoria ternatea TaxID=43366 RepID=A0AAN9K3P6_CLITE
MRGQDKKIEIPLPPTTTTTTTLGYNLPHRDSSSSSSKLSSPTIGERSSSDQQPPHQNTPHPLIFNEPSQSSHHHNLYPPPPPPPPIALTQHGQSQRPTSDPDLSSPPIIASTSNPPRTGPPQPTTTLVRYRECLRNHAASMGSHVVDGCGEFMASGEEGTPESLRCAACECHRNFHRKEVQGEHLQHQQQQQQPQHVPNYNHHQSYYPNKHNGHIHLPTPSSSSLHHQQQQQHHRFSHVVGTGPTASLVPPVMMAFGGPAESSSEDLNMFQSNAQLSVQQAPLSKKRFRTKFSQQQKDRMMEFAEKIGWKIQKHNEHEVQQFCSQLGVKRQVFKVWMHNNKQTIKKQQM